MKKGLFLILAVLALGALIAGLVSAQTTTTLTAILTGAAEVPGPGDTDGDGSVTVVVDTTENTACLTGSVTAVAFPITGLHIHDAPAGEAGPVVVDFLVTGNAAGIFVNQCGTGEPAVIADIVANPAEYYVNAHNAEFPGGAVRGQLEVVVIPTETAAATATATSTPFPGVELLSNGGFEEADATGPILGAWEDKNATGDKIKCNKIKDDGTEKIFSFEGECAFRFKGGVAENSKLSQTTDASGVANGAGDTLTLRGYAQTKNLTGVANAKVKVKYVDTTLGEKGDGKDKVKYDFPAGDAEYTLFTADVLTFAGSISQVKTQFGFKATAGKLYLDALSLKHIVAGVATATATTDAGVTATATTDAGVTATATTDAGVTATATTDATATDLPIVVPPTATATDLPLVQPLPLP